MLKIRLKRMGRKNRPFYRIVVMEGHRSTQGPNVEVLGFFNPRDKKKTLMINKERVAHWLDIGASPSSVMHNLFVDQGLIKGTKIKATRTKKKKKEKGEEKERKETAPQKEASEEPGQQAAPKKEAGSVAGDTAEKEQPETASKESSKE